MLSFRRLVRGGAAAQKGEHKLRNSPLLFLIVFFLCSGSVCEAESEGDVVMRPVLGRQPKHDGLYYAWSANLDQHSDAEYIVASGFEDGMDYSILRSLGDNSSLVFRFNPVLLNSSNGGDLYAWGYPSDIKNIIAKKENGEIRILCSFEHEVIRSENVSFPDWQKQVPVVFFTGQPTQSSKVGLIKQREWLTLDQVAVRARKGK